MNFYSKLISKQDPLTLKPMFKAIQIQLACSACIKAEKSHECQHMSHLIPRWQDSDKHRRLKVIMSDRLDLINSELGGIAIGNNDQCFRSVDLKRAFDTIPTLSIQNSIPFFITVDPAAGGEHSDFALVSFTITHGVYHILGAESLSTKDPYKTFVLLKQHIDCVRQKHSALMFSLAKIIIERNLGFEAEHMYRECRKIENVRFLKEANNDRIGALTTANIKLGFVTFTNSLFRENRIIVEKTHFVDGLKNKTREALFDQLSFFSFTFSTPMTVFHKERYAISGKGAGGKDDLAMAFLIGIYFSSDPRFLWIT